MLGTGARMVVQVEPLEWEPGLALRGWHCVCAGLGGQKHPAAWDGSRSFECVSVGSCKLLFYNPLAYLCGRGHFFFPLLILCFCLSSHRGHLPFLE